MQSSLTSEHQIQIAWLLIAGMSAVYFFSYMFFSIVRDIFRVKVLKGLSKLSMLCSYTFEYNKSKCNSFLYPFVDCCEKCIAEKIHSIKSTLWFYFIPRDFIVLFCKLIYEIYLCKKHSVYLFIQKYIRRIYRDSPFPCELCVETGYIGPRKDIRDCTCREGKFIRIDIGPTYEDDKEGNRSS